MIVQYSLIVVLVAGLVWKSVELARAPYDRLLRLLVLCLLLLTLGQVLGHLLTFPGPAAAFTAATAPGVGKVAYNAFLMAGLAALVLLLSAVEGRVRAVRTTLAAYAAVLIGMVVAMACTPASLREHWLATPHMAVPGIAAFYLVGNLYFLYAYTAAAWWAVRGAQRASRPIAVGLRVMALGLAALTLTSVVRVVWVFLRIGNPTGYAMLNSVNWSTNDVALAVVLAGLCSVAGVQMFRGWRSVVRYRRIYRQLAPLWTALTGAYPDVVLNRTPAGDRFRWRRMHQRCYRRVIECRDGLVRLSPYLAQVAAETDLSTVSPRVLARFITAALASIPGTEDSAALRHAVPVALPAGEDLEADTRVLIAVSAALEDGR